MIFLASLSFGAVFERPLTLAELANTSTVAVHGQILVTETEFKDGLIWTLATLEVWEGTQSVTSVQFRVPGGCVGDLCLNVSGTPSIHEDDQVVVFLRGDQVNSLALGLFHVDGDKLTYDSQDIAFVQSSPLSSQPTLTEFRRLLQNP